MRFSRNLLVVVVFAAWTLSCSSCKNGATPFKWPDFLTCGPDVGALVGSVTQILLNDTSSDTSPSVQQQLTQLAEQYGAAAVLCTVNVLAHDWSAPGASASPQRIAAAGRARAFLASTGTKIGDLLDQPSD